MRTMADIRAELDEIGLACARYPVTDHKLHWAARARNVAAILMRAMEVLGRELDIVIPPNCKDENCPDPSKWADHYYECWMNHAIRKAQEGKR